MTRRALIFGIGGQDGSYCADLLLEKGYEVHGVVRRSSYDNLARVAHCRNRLTIHYGDVTDYESVQRVVRTVGPDEVYNYADQDKVDYSAAVPLAQLAVTTGGCLNVLQASAYPPLGIRVLQPLSATMFGNSPPPQNEQTPLRPQSPYACAKAAAWHLCHHYRQEHGLYVACPIFFNHDSERRSGGYLLQKIARGEELRGNLDAVVDVGYAPEYVEAAWKMLQLDGPRDFVIGTGRGYVIRDLLSPHPVPVLPKAGLVADCREAHDAFGWNPKEDAYSVLRRLRHFRQTGKVTSC